MNCPFCGAEHQEAQGRFCESCGRSVSTLVQREESPEVEDDENKVRCRHCGLMTAAAVCPSCGHRMPAPEE